VKVDEWGIDICYAGTQKCLEQPPGLAPITFSPKRRIRSGSGPIEGQSFYFDMNLLEKYWGSERLTTTPPLSRMNYALWSPCDRERGGPGLPVRTPSPES